MAGNPVRGTLLTLILEVFTVYFLAIIATQGGDWAKAAVVLLVILFTLFFMRHGMQVQAVLHTAEAGSPVLKPTPVTPPIGKVPAVK